MGEHKAPKRVQKRKAPVFLLFFPLALLYHELMLHACDENIVFRDGLAAICLFSLAAGLFVSLLLALLPRRWARGIGIGLVFLFTVYTCVQTCCKGYFKSYFELSFVVQTTGSVLQDFWQPMLEVILDRLGFIFLSLIPLAVLIIFRRVLLPEGKADSHWLSVLLLFAVASQCGGWAMCRNDAEYRSDFTADLALPRYGVFTTLRLEAQYAAFGMPAPVPVELPEEDTIDAEASDEPIVYGYNALDIDFASLAETETNKDIANIHRYFASLTPSQKNEYTGLFKGKNLILLTAEAFSPYVISKELTPTLYRLSHEGIVAKNFYQPFWSQSTTGGEYAVMTGFIPTWIGGKTSFHVSASKSMPLGLGWQFQKLGYQCLAWHDNSYDYYFRDETHPNLGYEYTGIGNGLVLEGKRNAGKWPYSDLEMMQATAEIYIKEYCATKKPFHAYYMTVSGHCNYGWGHAMSKVNREAAEAAYPDASTTVQAYIAANLELEYALQYLVDTLEQYGIAEDTVICLAADHYPYALAEKDKDYYQELSGTKYTERDTERFRNTLLLWCGGMEEPIYVDAPCTAVDIVPTLCNLFGLEYDSRLYSGRDILATNYEPDKASACMPLAFIPTAAGKSWATAAGVYESATGTFTPRPGITVDENYVKTVNQLVNNKYTYAKLVIQNDYFKALFG